MRTITFCRQASCGQATPLFVEALESRQLLTKIAWVGDLNSGSGLRDVSTMVKGWSPAAIVTSGDNLHSDTSYDTSVGQYFHDYIAPYTGTKGAGASTNKFWPALGNHDYENGVSKYWNYFTLPGNERYYATPQYGSAQFFIVNSNSQDADGTSSGSKQGQWLKGALASSSATWKIVVFHHPAFTSGTEGNHSNMQWPFADWGATAVFSGHDHQYERILKNNFPFFVNGLAGAPIVPAQRVESGSQVRYAGDNGAMLIDAQADTISFKFFSRDGTVRDNYTISKAGAQVAPDTNSSVPAPWKTSDVGSVGKTGSARYADKTFEVAGAGTDVWTNADGFRYVYQPFDGDGTIVTRVTYMSSAKSWAKAGVMFRESLSADAKAVAMQVSYSEGTVMTYRTSTGASTDGTFGSGSIPQWLKLTRSGKTFTSYNSIDGVNFKLLGTKIVSMKTSVYVGLTVTAKSTTTPINVNFRNVAVTKPTTTQARAASYTDTAQTAAAVSSSSKKRTSAMALIS